MMSQVGRSLGLKKSKRSTSLKNSPAGQSLKLNAGNCHELLPDFPSFSNEGGDSLSFHLDQISESVLEDFNSLNEHNFDEASPRIFKPVHLPTLFRKKWKKISRNPKATEATAMQSSKLTLVDKIKIMFHHLTRNYVDRKAKMSLNLKHGQSLPSDCLAEQLDLCLKELSLSPRQRHSKGKAKSLTGSLQSQSGAKRRPKRRTKKPRPATLYPLHCSKYRKPKNRNKRPQQLDRKILEFLLQKRIFGQSWPLFQTTVHDEEDLPIDETVFIANRRPAYHIHFKRTVAKVIKSLPRSDLYELMESQSVVSRVNTSQFTDYTKIIGCCPFRGTSLIETPKFAFLKRDFPQPEGSDCANN